MKNTGFRQFGVLVLMIPALMGCESKTVSQVIDELRSDKYLRTVEAGNHVLNFRFIPENLVALTRYSLDSNTVFSKKILEKAKANMGSAYALTFHMELAPKEEGEINNYQADVVYGGLSGQSYQETLNKYLFGLNENIWLEVDGKRFDLPNYHMVRSWGMTKSRSFMLMFDQFDKKVIEELESVTLVAESIVPGQGRNKFTWKLPISEFESVS